MLRIIAMRWLGLVAAVAALMPLSVAIGQDTGPTDDEPFATVVVPGPLLDSGPLLGVGLDDVIASVVSPTFV
jgi:hypothetical protein